MEGLHPITAAYGGDANDNPSTSSALTQAVTANITSISPSSGVAGTQVTITGTSFGSSQGTSDVTFGTLVASPTSWSDTSISVSAPAGVMTSNVTVIEANASSNGVIFRAPTGNFTPTASLYSARWLPMATVPDSGQVLIAGGLDGNWNGLSGEGLYDPNGVNFTPTGNLNTGRGCAAATLLNTGQVLVMGGWDGNGNTLASAELYDPVVGAFTVLPTSMTTARACHTALVLNNGNVLITGGFDKNGNPLNSAELFNPATEAFTATTAAMNTARALPTVTLLNSGLVLIAGGLESQWNGLPTAETYNPATGSFTLTGNLNTARGWATANLLDTGQVLVTGGYNSNGNALASAELYNPVTGTFTATGALNTGRAAHGATLLNDDKVLIAGGWDDYGNSLASAELYDPATGAFTIEGSMNDMRAGPGAVLLNDGQVLVVAGLEPGTLTSAELYQPAALAPPGLVSITVSPQNPSVGLGGTVQLVATGTFSDNSTQTLQSATWSSSATSVATVSNDPSDYGEALRVSAGAGTLSACTGSICGSTTLTVASAPAGAAPIITNLSPNFGPRVPWCPSKAPTSGLWRINTSVTFNGVQVSPTMWDATSITLTVPSGATSGNVVVTVNGVASNGMTFTVASEHGATVLSDSMGRVTVYGYQNIDGRNFMSSVAGSGCASCGGRGNTA